jgi:hypothetical protein
MSVSPAFKKAVSGCLIPPRTFTQMLTSSFRGAVSLLNETNRAEFIEKLDKGIINEGVISQATTGPLHLLSLVHDLQNPLFKRYKFSAKAFLEGVAPALESFHNASVALENKFHTICKDVQLSSKEEEDNPIQGDEVPAGSKTTEENVQVKGDDEEYLLSVLRKYQSEDLVSSNLEEKQVAAILNHEWMDEAKKNPESFAGQMSRMMTTEMFQMHQLLTKSSFVLQNHNRTISLEEGSCTVNNVALLSARAFLCAPREGDENGKYYDIAEYFDGFDESTTGVAAQLEVLYDVTQTYTIKENPIKKGADETKDGDAAMTKETGSEPESMTTTIVSVATIEGWLKRVEEDNGEPRWRLALLRPAFEFPGMPQE